MYRFPDPLDEDSLKPLVADERYGNALHPEYPFYRKFVDRAFALVYPDPPRDGAGNFVIDPRDPPKPQVITGGAEFKPWEDGLDQFPMSSSLDWLETQSHSRLSTTTDGTRLDLGGAGENDDRRSGDEQNDPATSSPFAVGPRTAQRTQYWSVPTPNPKDEEPQLNRPRLAQAARTIEREDAVERQMQARAGEAAAEETRRLTAPSGRDLADILDDLGRSNALDQDVDEVRRLRLEALAKPEDELAQLRFENKKFKLAEKIRHQLPLIVGKVALEHVPYGSLANVLVDFILDSTLEHAVKQPPKPTDRKRTPDEATRALAESGRYGAYRERESPDQRAYDRIFKPTD